MVNLSDRTAIAGFDEIRALITELPGPDMEAAAATEIRERALTKPPGALGRLEALSAWLATWQGRHPPRADHPRTAVFAGNHGVAARGVSAYPAAVTAEMVQNFITGGAAVNQLCQVFDADLRVYELDLEHPTLDFTNAPAMTEIECVQAMAYGMTVVEPGIDILCLGEMGIGNTTAAAAMSMALFGGEARDWTGAGTGVVGEAFARKIDMVTAGVLRHADLRQDPLATLAALGGREMAAICGAVLAARLARVPIVLDGFTCTAAAAVLHVARPGLLDHCIVSHLSVEPGHRRMLEVIGVEPLLDLNMRLGEGSGATLALGLLKAAVACHVGMASFESAGVSGPEQS